MTKANTGFFLNEKTHYIDNSGISKDFMDFSKICKIILLNCLFCLMAINLQYYSDTIIGTAVGSKGSCSVELS